MRAGPPRTWASRVRGDVVKLVALISVLGCCVTAFVYWSDSRASKTIHDITEYHLGSTVHAATARRQVVALQSRLQLRPGEYSYRPRSSNATLMYLLRAELDELQKLQQRFKGIAFEALLGRLQDRIERFRERPFREWEADAVPARRALSRLEVMLTQVESLHLIEYSARLQSEEARRSRELILLTVFLLAAVGIGIALTRRGLRGIQAIVEREEADRARLVESEQRFQSAFHDAPLGGLLLDHDGNLMDFNPAAEAIFARSADSVRGQNVATLLSSNDAARLHEYLRSGGTAQLHADHDLVGLRENGKTFPLSLHIGALTRGSERAYIATVTDLTEVRSLEARLRQSQRLEAVGQLTGGIAHDFNNLMGIMLGNAELLREAEDDAERENGIAAILDAIERASSLTRRLLAFSRRQPLSPITTNVAILVNGLGDMLRRTLGEAIEIIIEPCDRCWCARFDPHEFENALVNLALNARDAMPQGGSLVIEFSNTSLDAEYCSQHLELEPGDYVVIAVSDSGCGMPAEVAQKAFEPFFTTKTPVRGTGLGLSMVFGFVKQSGGHITIYSEVDQGTIVKIYLPRSNEPLSEPPRDTIPAPPVPGQGQCILVVEDDDNLRQVFTTTLQKHGYTVVDAANGPQAIDIVAAGPPIDLLITDVVLPSGMNGAATARAAARLQPGLRVLYMTGYTQNAIVHRGELDPSVELLNKPFSPADLLRKVTAMLTTAPSPAA